MTDYNVRKIRSLVKNRKLLNGRRDALAEAAISLFAAKGFDNVTIDDIAKLAHMSKGTIYNYIGCKEDLVFLILDDVNRDFYTKVSKNLNEHNAVKWIDVLRAAQGSLRARRIRDDVPREQVFAGDGRDAGRCGGGVNTSRLAVAGTATIVCHGLLANP